MATKTPEEIEKEKLNTKVDDKIKDAEKKVEAAGGRVNLIGDLQAPEPENKAEFKDWAKRLDEKIDSLISELKLKNKENVVPEPKKEEPVPEPKKVPWYERELI